MHSALFKEHLFIFFISELFSYFSIFKEKKKHLSQKKKIKKNKIIYVHFNLWCVHIFILNFVIILGGNIISVSTFSPYFYFGSYFFFYCF